MMKKAIYLLFCLGCIFSARAEELSCSSLVDEQEITECYVQKSKADKTFPFLSSNNPNFFGWAVPLSNGKLEDDRHLEFSVSIKYPLFSSTKKWLSSWQTFEQTGEVLSVLSPNRIYFIYNGDYDFYALNSDRYTSSPIISRRQNPGLAGEWDIYRNTDRSDWLRLGWFHESNGQSLNTKEDFNNQVEELDKNGQQKGYEYALAQASRGWDYAQFRYEVTSNDSPVNHNYGWWKAHIDLRYYLDSQFLGSNDKEDEIFWEDVNEQPKISDYDGLRIVGERSYFWKKWPFSVDKNTMWRVELKTGTSDMKALENLTYKISLSGKVANARVSLFYFDGYGKEPSTYNYRTNYIGLGLELR